MEAQGALTISYPKSAEWSPDSYSFYSSLKLRKIHERTVRFLTRIRH